MLSFNFNKNKEMGVKEIQIGNKVVVEAVVYAKKSLRGDLMLLNHYVFLRTLQHRAKS